MILGNGRRNAKMILPARLQGATVALGIFVVVFLSSLALGGTNTLTLLITGENNGYLEPCGCTSHRLGGLSRRHSCVVALRAKPFILLDNGDIVNEPGRQQEIKYEISLQAMKEMGYAAVNVGEGDLNIGLDYLKYLAGTQPVKFLSANLFDKAGERPFLPALRETLSIGATAWDVCIVGVLSQEFAREVREIEPELRIADPVAALRQELAQESSPRTLLIVLSHGSLVFAKDLAAHVPQIDIIITGHGRGVPLQDEIRVGKTRIFNPGSRGLYLLQVEVTRDDAGTFGVSLPRQIEMSDAFPESPIVNDLLKLYQQTMIAENLAAKREKKMPPQPEGSPNAEARYVGSAACKPCHPAAYEIWSRSSHARAFKTLVAKNHDRDPECIPCHVVGYGYLSGFDDENTTAELANVGCESCHGVASEHVKKAQRGFGVANEASCHRCHTAEQSPQFEFRAYYSKIGHKEDTSTSASRGVRSLHSAVPQTIWREARKE
jgi:hypothetical protein